MLTAEIKVNGALVGVLYARNVTQGPFKDPEYSPNEYEIEYYRTGKGLRTDRISHVPKDGIEALIVASVERLAK